MEMPRTDQIYIPLKGGLDQTTPPLEAAPGSLRDSSNFDVNILGGYRRIDGYERWDGTQLANTYGYYSMVVATTGAIDPGRTLVGVNSGATGRVLGAGAAGEIFFALPTGTFEISEPVTILGSVVGTVTTEPYNRLDRSTAESAEYMALATDVHRESVLAVPGSGAVLGMQYYAGALYAFRNAADGLTCGVYKSSGAGWAAVNLGIKIEFTAAGGTVLDGQVLTRGGVTSTISRVVIRSGTLLAGTAAGSLIITSPSGAYTAGAATTPGGTLTLTATQAAITHAPGGRVRAVLSNFGSGQKMYWCSGVDYAYEFDGTTTVPIVTGMTTDTPAFITVHKNHLFLAFDNSLQHSSIGTPYVWSPVTGAGELNMGEEITNILPQPSDAQSGGAMVISTRNSIFVVYGSSAADWKLVTFQRDAGSLAHTMQSIAANTYYFDDRGITNLSMAQEFGNFNAASISTAAREWLVIRKSNVLDSCVVKEKNQLRLFFSGGTGMHITFNGKELSGLMPIQYAHNIVASHSTEFASGVEAVFLGDDTGNVYLADSGPSFAGETITAFFKMQFNHCKSPRVKKRFRKATFEVGGGGYADFDVGVELGYGSFDVGVQTLEPVNVEFAGARWDDPALFWDSAVWDGRVLLPVEVSLDGTEENIAMTVYQSSDKYMALNFQGALLQYTPRRIKR